MNKFFIVLLAAIIFTVLYFLAPILTPFLVGILLAYLVNPVVNWLMRLHLPRILAVAIVFFALLFVITFAVLLIIPLIQTQIDHLIDVLPTFMAWIQNTAIPLIKEHFNNDQFINVPLLKEQFSQNWLKAGGAAGWIVGAILHSGFTVLHALFNVLLVFVVTFYLLYDWQKVVDGLHDLLPRKYEPTIMKLVMECNDVLGAFFRGQLLVMLTLGTFYSIGLTLMGLQVGVVIGVMIGVLTVIPYLGTIVGLLTASIAIFIQFGSITAIIPVLLLFAVGQTLDGMFITPKLVGNRIGLHPVAVIFAVLAGGVLFGFFGVLLALPVASIIMVLIRFLRSYYYKSALYQ